MDKLQVNDDIEHVELRRSTRLQRGMRVTSRKTRDCSPPNFYVVTGDIDVDEAFLPKSPPQLDQEKVNLKEDMSKIKSAFIGNSVPSSPGLEDSVKSSRVSDDSSRFKMFLSKKTSGVKYNTLSLTAVKVKEKFSRLAGGDSYTQAIHSGVLAEFGGRGESRTEWRVSLDSQQLRLVSDNGKITANLSKITSVTAVPSSDSDFAHGLEVTSGTTEGSVPRLAARTYEERALWMHHIVETCMTSPFPDSLSTEFTRAGLVDIKEGVGGTWVTTWMLQKDRDLFYCMPPGVTLLAADLRKARTVGNHGNEGSVLLDLQDRVMYVRASTEHETRRWRASLREAALNSGVALTQLQLDRHDLPVVVDACVKFVTTHGSGVEGLYRHAMNQGAVHRLVSQFKLKDAWKLHLDQEHVSDVAVALTTFLAQLHEQIIPEHLARQLAHTATLDDPLIFVHVTESEHEAGRRVSGYRAAVHELPRVHLATCRRVLGHLHVLHRAGGQCARSLVDSWVTCLAADKMLLLEEYFARAVEELVTDHYSHVFDASEDEVENELRLVRAAQRMSDPDHLPRTCAAAGDLLVWVSVGQYFSSDQVQISLDSDTTAGDVVAQLGAAAGWYLQETTLGGALVRPMHAMESVLSCVLDWQQWQDKDRKDNQLVLAPSSMYEEVKAKSKARAVTSGELKFADMTSRHAVTCDVELTQTHLTCYKDRKSGVKLGEWRVDDLVWYIGNEPKRETMSKWTITFMTRYSIPPRTREQPYFGYILSGSRKKDLHRFISGLLLAKYPGMLR